MAENRPGDVEAGQREAVEGRPGRRRRGRTEDPEAGPGMGVSGDPGRDAEARYQEARPRSLSLGGKGEGGQAGVLRRVVGGWTPEREAAEIQD